jgi:hypothetical protein
LKGGIEYIESTRQRHHRQRVDRTNLQPESCAGARDETEVESNSDEVQDDLSDMTEEEETTEWDDLLSLFDDSDENLEITRVI